MENPLLGLSLVFVLGAGAQWVASALRLPSILVLLLAGFAVGPELAGLLHPDLLLGDLLLPLVSLSVAILLFEGGLSLRLSELAATGGVVVRLVTVGAAITWLGAAAAAHLLLGLGDLALAVLLGAVLTVTGPTVVLPLLRQIRPTGTVGPILKWEGILIDPIGAVLAVLVFEGIVAGSVGAATWGAVLGIAKTLGVGCGIGIVTAWLLALFLERYWIPDHLHSPVALSTALGVFTLSNALQHESGLLTVTILGVALANQRRVSVRHILEFKENVRVLVISALFVILAARVRLDDFARLDLGTVFFLLALVVVVRPLCVLASTAGSSLGRRERWFLAGVAPRGIVAAAVASVFALRLEQQGVAAASTLVPTTFLVIVFTVALYGLAAAPLAHRLGLAVPRPQGVLMLGAQDWARSLAAILTEHGIRVLLVDANPRNAAAARMAGLSVHHGSLLAEDADDKLNLAGIGRLLALTPNDEVNSLSAIHYVHLFGRREVYQLQPGRVPPGHDKSVSAHLRGRYLFGGELDHDTIEAHFERGARFKATKLTDQFDFPAWRAEHGDDAEPLFSIDAEGVLTAATSNTPLDPRPGQILIGLV
jgi:NhaP-type Na+/H+ or K+/H+ antiporter